MNWFKNVFKIKATKQCDIHIVRQRSVVWWRELPIIEKKIIERDYFDGCCSGEITDIDLECMYREYVA